MTDTKPDDIDDAEFFDAPSRKRWPLVVLCTLLGLCAGATAAWWWFAESEPTPVRLAAPAEETSLLAIANLDEVPENEFPEQWNWSSRNDLRSTTRKTLDVEYLAEDGTPVVREEVTSRWEVSGIVTDSDEKIRFATIIAEAEFLRWLSEWLPGADYKRVVPEEKEPRETRIWFFYRAADDAGEYDGTFTFSLWPIDDPEKTGPEQKWILGLELEERRKATLKRHLDPDED